MPNSSIAHKAAAIQETNDAINAARDEAKAWYAKLMDLGRQQSELAGKKDTYDRLVEKQNKSEVWLVPGSKPPINFPVGE